MSTGISIQGLRVAFGEQVIYDNFSADFLGGQITAILGASGEGKTTLLNAVAGSTPYKGTVTGAGKIAYCFQEARLIPNLSVAGNLRFVAGKAFDPQELLSAVELDDVAAKFPAELSGGMQARVSLARAFSVPADTLLLDEPFRALDLGLKNRMIQYFKTLYDNRPCTVLFVTHAPEEAAAIGHRIIGLKEGKIALELLKEPGFDMRRTDENTVKRLKAFSLDC